MKWWLRSALQTTQMWGCLYHFGQRWNLLFRTHTSERQEWKPHRSLPPTLFLRPTSHAAAPGMFQHHPPVSKMLVSLFLFLRILFYYLFTYFWLRWVFVAARGLSLVVVSGGYSLLWCAAYSLRWLLLLQSTSSRHTGFSSCGTRAQ